MKFYILFTNNNLAPSVHFCVHKNLLFFIKNMMNGEQWNEK